MYLNSHVDIQDTCVTMKLMKANGRQFIKCTDRILEIAFSWSVPETLSGILTRHPRDEECACCTSGTYTGEWKINPMLYESSRARRE